MKLIITALLLLSSVSASAACKWVWVDHDYNMGTPAVKKQVCDSSIDLPAIQQPTLRPLQTPQLRPIESPRLPPIGTSQCRTQSVFENGRWVNKQICR